MATRRHAIRHRRSARYSAVLGSVVLACASGAVRAQSTWQICNDTPESIDYAIAFPQGQGLRARGWYTLAPGACYTFNFKSIYREVHWRAMSRTKLFPPSRGNVMLCVDRPQPFDIEDARSWQGGCASRHKVEPFYSIPFTGNQTVTRITSAMGGPLLKSHRLD